MTLAADIQQVRAEFEARYKDLQSGLGDRESLRIAFLGRKGALTPLFARLAKLPREQRPGAGQELNELKVYLTEKLQALESLPVSTKTVKKTGRSAARSTRDSDAVARGTDRLYSTEAELDLSLPGDPIPLGTIHPLTRIQEQIKSIFLRLGFSVFYGPEVETEFYNFGALNFQPDHPAQDMQDTFYVSPGDIPERDAAAAGERPKLVLRTHTSNNQIHAMETLAPPLRIIMPGRVYRNEAISARSYCLFHQIEGLVVDRHTSLAELKGTLEHCARQLYGKEVRTRFRPSYFPFTEPSAEMDIYWGLETDTDRRITKGTGWLEILGCGMVHPKVLEAVNIDPQEWTGYAFGMGIEHMAMLKWGIGDIRLFYEGDLRFLRQF